ncbi:hypothetical protein COL5a_000861 [Colletotrichum fioriniae]|uniref:uncharacterized protein n=1 Tax=Colletotrichum fioriniae TaxID=710243 RepID=UPI0022FFF697|nr:uncharacterized protein COL516b_003502 [Colletotrichum fioriniae]KAJ0308233.1 hypothetical protein COL516b_003502 [Colletotrichum fioriniae]KAJ0334798.1 hypothetical protein COL5a_000861 [Colletotrichum fioriniae]KAJ3947449.1 hypothetical protein N0V96_003840 [Colletotrichum fioriniae]
MPSASTQPTGQAPAQTPTPTPKIITNAAWAGVVLCPLIMLMPPRRIDWRTFMLWTGFSASGNQLIYDYSGQSLFQRMQSRLGRMFPTTLPEQAQRTKQLLREERMRREGLTEEQMRAIEFKKRNLAQRLWYGSEPEDWEAKRAAEHAKALAEGKGLGDLIAEQVSEVWSGAKKEVEEEQGQKNDSEKKQ